jgi:hypothetical protein
MAKVEIVVAKREMAKEIIRKQNGKFFTAVFASKKDGRRCEVNGRTGVHKFQSGGKNPAAGKVDLLTAFSVKKMNYRNVNLDGIQEIRANGVVYKFV